MLTVSAPGKLMLFGEHAVVYGYPCITTAMDTRLSVDIEEADGDHVVIDAPEVKDTRFVDAAIAYAAKEWGVPQKGYKLTTKSNFSGKYGFGSSSAVTVAALSAVAHFFHKTIGPKELFDAAYGIVLSVQGAASGFDVASATYGGTLYYIKGGSVLEPLFNSSFWGGVVDDSRIKGRDPGQARMTEIPLVVGYTGVKANTSDFIRAVGEKRKKYPEKVEKIFGAIAKIVDDAKVKMLEGDWERVGRLMDFNQEYLRDLGVSSEKLETLISAAKKAGAYGAKLSGAGGGDCMIALVSPEKRQAVEDAIRDAGGEVVSVAPNTQGVRVESGDNQEELFVVVDKDDNILGYKTRYECHHDKSLIHRATGLLIFDSHGRVLLQKRSMQKDTNPGWWTDSASGHVAKGESYEEAVRREMKEELGIDTAVVYTGKIIHEYPWETEMEAFFTAKHDGPFRIEPTEIDEVRFVSKDELPRLLLSREIQLTGIAEQSLKMVGFL